MAKSILKATGVVLLMNLVVKVLGFMRETSLANAFGASELSDAYLSAYTIPYFLQAILGFALVTAVVPILTGGRAEGGGILCRQCDHQRNGTAVDGADRPGHIGVRSAGTPAGTGLWCGAGGTDG